MNLRQWTATLAMLGVLVNGAICFDYCATPCVFKQTYKHTMCLFLKEVPGPMCKSLDMSKDLTEKDKQHLLKMHNELRSKVAEGKESRGSPGPQPAAANMMELVWDNELELIAKRWALQCDYKHDQCRSTKDRMYAGQNLAVTSDSEGFQNDLETQVMSWYDEVELMPQNTVDTFQSAHTASGAIGHYTQLVWAETSRVGCSRVFFDYSHWGMTEYLVCNYAPGGNVQSQPMYKKGKPCTSCPYGLKCNKYLGLCAASSAAVVPAGTTDEAGDGDTEEGGDGETEEGGDGETEEVSYGDTEKVGDGETKKVSYGETEEVKDSRKDKASDNRDKTSTASGGPTASRKDTTTDLISRTRSGAVTSHWKPILTIILLIVLHLI